MRWSALQQNCGDDAIVKRFPVYNMVECKSRGAYLMGLMTYSNYEIEDQVNFTVYVPKVNEHFFESLAVIPLQLLGYYVSIAKGLDVDKLRNLAKSVTVE